jgi:hypothetical protein
MWISADMFVQALRDVGVPSIEVFAKTVAS